MAAIRPLSNEVALSAATIWELAIKVGLKKIVMSMPYRQWMEKAIVELKLTALPITMAYAERQCSLPSHHRDPFDRLMIAQALTDQIPIISSNTAFDSYGVDRI